MIGFSKENQAILDDFIGRLKALNASNPDAVNEMGTELQMLIKTRKISPSQFDELEADIGRMLLSINNNSQSPSVYEQRL